MACISLQALCAAQAIFASSVHRRGQPCAHPSRVSFTHRFLYIFFSTPSSPSFFFAHHFSACPCMTAPVTCTSTRGRAHQSSTLSLHPFLGFPLFLFPIFSLSTSSSNTFVPLRQLNPRKQRLKYHDTGQPRGIGFCAYKDPATANAAIRNLNGKELNGRSVLCGVQRN